MTKREREILIKSVSWTDKYLTVNEEKAFQEGAKWADITMINKACEWLDEHYFKEVTETPFNHWIELFKKAMEEDL